MDALTRVGMPLDDFIRELDRQPFELIDGERIIKVGNVAKHSRVIRTLFRALDAFALAAEAGEVFAETTFVLSYDSTWVEGSRIPDLMFFAAEKIAAYQAAHPDWENQPFVLIPDLVIEVISPTDSYTAVDEKVDRYLADGVPVVWAINPQRQKVHIHRPDDEQPIVLKGDAVLRGEGALTGFELPLRDLFE